MSNGSQQLRERKKIPGAFGNPTQKLQKPEQDIMEKIKFFEERLRELNSETSGVRTAQSAGNQENVRLKGANREITRSKIKDLDKELADLDKAVKTSVKLRSNVSPDTGGTNVEGKITGQGMARTGSIPKVSRSPQEVTNLSRTYIVARDTSTVWVWNRKSQAWDAMLETEDKIVGVEQVGEQIAVYTKSNLWLFHPTEFRWVGELHAQIEEVSAFDLSVPAVRHKAK